MKKIILIIAIFFSINSLYAVESAQKALNFTAKTLEGKQISLEQFKGKKAVWLVFWATWCPYCEREIPALKELHERYSDKLEIIGINIGVNDSVEKARNYKEKNTLPYDIIVSTDITQLYKVRGTPTQVVIDINGNIVYKGTRVPLNITDEAIVQITTK